MKMRIFIVAFAVLLSLFMLVSCSEGNDYEVGSGTASFTKTEESNGLVNEGEINDASDWGPVIGIQ